MAEHSIDFRVERMNFMRSVSTLSAMLIVVVIVAALWALRDILMPLALALLLSFVLAPVVRGLTRRRAPRALAVPLVVLVAFAGIFALGALFAGQVSQLAAELPTYQTTLREKVRALRASAAEKGSLGKAGELLQNLAEELNGDGKGGKAATSAPAAGASSSAPAPDAARAQPPAPIRPIPVEVHERKGALAALAAMLAPLTHPLATTAMIVIFVIFILAQREDLRNRFIKLVGTRDLHRTTAALDDAANRLSRLFAAQLALNATFGVAIGVGLWLIGVPNPLLWGVLAGVLRFVPYVGAFVSAAFPAVLAFAVDPGWSMLVWVLLLFGVVEPIVGHVIEPMLLGHTTGLSPIAVVVSATFWTWLWGPIGLVLATPLTVCLVVLGKHVEGLRFIDTLLGDQPALSSAELFYQRMLAGDPVEASAQIEHYGQKNALLGYYDEVALAGLRLAQNDRDRSMLDEARARRLRATVDELFAGLAQEDLAPPRDAREPGAQANALVALAPEDIDDSWRGEAPVLVVGGRSDLDEAAAILLADALTRAGLKGRVLPAEILRGAGPDALPAEGVKMIIVSFLDDSSEPAMRYVLRRVRAKAPRDARIVLAVWADPDEQIDVERLRETTRADLVALTIREVVNEARLAALAGAAHADIAPLPEAATPRAGVPSAAAPAPAQTRSASTAGGVTAGV